jgi:hypothetical protein
MSIFNRMFNYFHLKPKVQSEISTFVVIGMIPGIFVAFKVFMMVLHFLDFTPDTKLQSVENGGLIMIGIGLIMIVVVALFMFLGAILHAVFLTVTSRMKFWEAWDATVLNKYPHYWFK